MVAAEAVEYFDGFAHPSLARTQEPVQQSGPGMVGTAREQRVENRARFRVAIFGRERKRAPEVGIGWRGRGREGRQEREQHLLHRCY